MKKEKKITIQPFLNDKVKKKEIGDKRELLPLYYQIIYNRNNTHLLASKLFKRDRSEFLFSNMDDVFSSPETMKTFRYDVQVITKVIRYLEPSLEKQSIALIDDVLPIFTENVFVILNRNLKSFIRDHLLKGSNAAVTQIIDWENEELTFTFVLFVLGNLINVQIEYGQEILKKISAIDYYFKIFHVQIIQISDEVVHPENPKFPLRLKLGYNLIDWKVGTLVQEIKTLSRATNFKIDPVELIDSINWGIGLNDNDSKVPMG